MTTIKEVMKPHFGKKFYDSQVFYKFLQSIFAHELFHKGLVSVECNMEDFMDLLWRNRWLTNGFDEEGKEYLVLRDYTPPTFKERLTKIMADKKLSDKDVRRAIGCSKTTIQSWLNGKTKPHKFMIEPIFKILGELK